MVIFFYIIKEKVLQKPNLKNYKLLFLRILKIQPLMFPNQQLMALKIRDLVLGRK